jgi:SHS2 domain-containing protein
MKFKFLSHTADIKFLAYGRSVEEVFENSALALFNSLCEKKVKAKSKIVIQAMGNDLEGLMYNFLEEFLFLLDSENFMPSKIKNLHIDKTNFKIKCEVYGDDAVNYKVSHIKAITYNDMFIREERGKWFAQIVLDV